MLLLEDKASLAFLCLSYASSYTLQVVVLEGTESQLSDITAAKTHNGSVSVVLYNKLFDQVRFILK